MSEVDLPYGFEKRKMNTIDGEVEISILKASDGVEYIKMTDAARLVDYTLVGFRRRIIQYEQEKNKKIRVDFYGMGGTVWISLQEIQKIFFTPHTTDRD